MDKSENQEQRPENAPAAEASPTPPVVEADSPREDAQKPAPRAARGADPQSVWREHHERLSRLEEKVHAPAKKRGLMAWLMEDAE